MQCNKPVTINAGTESFSGSIVDYSAGGMGIAFDGGVIRTGSKLSIGLLNTKIDLFVHWSQGNRFGGSFAVMPSAAISSARIT